MKKCMLLFFAVILTGYCLLAQQTLMIKNNSGNFYLEHIVSAKENFYSIGRLYNIPPKELSAYNNLDMANGLSIGQMIKIPLTIANFSQVSDKGTPVYYKVGEKEGLYRVSVNNNKVLMENLRKWNNLSNDNIAAGSNIIVGYLTSAEAPAATATKTNTEAITPSLKETVNDATAVKTEIKENISAVKDLQQTNPGDGGYFKSHFDQQVKAYPVSKDQAVTAGIFKTASGWQDGKYYLLMDNIEPGVIVKITNPTTGKVVYAKVLGQMSGTRQNQGLSIRISNAAASTLQVDETDKFIVKVNY